MPPFRNVPPSFSIANESNVEQKLILLHKCTIFPLCKIAVCFQLSFINTERAYQFPQIPAHHFTE